MPPRTANTVLHRQLHMLRASCRPCITAVSPLLASCGRRASSSPRPAEMQVVPPCSRFVPRCAGRGQRRPFPWVSHNGRGQCPRSPSRTRPSPSTAAGPPRRWERLCSAALADISFCRCDERLFASGGGLPLRGKGNRRGASGRDFRFPGRKQRSDADDETPADRPSREWRFIGTGRGANKTSAVARPGELRPRRRSSGRRPIGEPGPRPGPLRLVKANQSRRPGFGEARDAAGALGSTRRRRSGATNDSRFTREGGGCRRRQAGRTIGTAIDLGKE
jgi:hypothetical protein